MKKIFLLISIVLFATYTSYGQNIWTPKANFGGMPRLGATGFSIGNKGYIGTGATNFNAGTFTKDFWEYDRLTDTWTQKADFGGVARHKAAGFSLGNKGYIGTGLSNNFGSLLSDFWEYNPIANTWTQKTDFGGAARYNAVGFSIENKGYIGTGYASGHTNDFWEYDPTTNTWTQKANFGGTPRESATGFSIDNKGYIGSGGTNISTLKNDFWVYDPNANSWSEIASFPGVARAGATGFGIGKKGYFGTGQTGSTTFNDFWEYDPTTNTWTQKTNFGGTARDYATCFNIGDKGYIGTGSNEANWITYPTDFWEYTPLLNNIATNSITGSPFCAGNPVGVSFTTVGAANSGNTFTAQLSDAAGDFSSPVNIGTLNSTTPGTISATIPSNTSAGNRYRIRVVSSDPVVTGSDNASDLTINACRCTNATGLTTTNITSNSATLNWTASVNPARWQIQYKKATPGAKWTNIKPAGSARSVNILSLTANQTYKWHIRAKCGTTWTAYSSLKNFKTLVTLQANNEQSISLQEADIKKSSILRLYPNPNKGQFIIDFIMKEKPSANAKIELVNTQGQTISTENASISNGRLQKNISMTSSLSQGTYLVKVIVNGKIYVAKLIYVK